MQFIYFVINTLVLATKWCSLGCFVQAEKVDDCYCEKNVGVGHLVSTFSQCA